ncbi:MAG: hypothetical protein ACR2M6_01030 [Vampirovibrionia bacterium]
MERTMKKSIGSIDCVFGLPKSMSTVWDVFYMISTNPNRAQLGRLFAGLVGVTIQNQPSCPKYSLSDCDLMAYGGRVQEWLASQKVNPIEVLTVGTELFQMMTEHISTDKEVEVAENFTSPPPAE